MCSSVSGPVNWFFAISRKGYGITIEHITQTGRCQQLQVNKSPGCFEIHALCTEFSDDAKTTCICLECLKIDQFCIGDF